MYFALISRDREGSLPLRRAARPMHLARLEVLAAEGRLLLAGPFPAVEAGEPGEAGFTGSLIVAEFPSHAEAEAWAAQDPYRLQGIFVETVVKPFRRVLP